MHLGKSAKQEEYEFFSLKHFEIYNNIVVRVV